jgi:hypothetical protein
VAESALRSQLDRRAGKGTRPLLSVVPVFNLAETIGDNLRLIRERVEDAFGERIELIVDADHRPTHRSGCTADVHARFVAASLSVCHG